MEKIKYGSNRCENSCNLYRSDEKSEILFSRIPFRSFDSNKHLLFVSPSLLVWTWTSVNARVQATIKAFGIFRLTYAAVNLSTANRKLSIIIARTKNSGKLSRIAAEGAATVVLNVTSIIGESSQFPMMASCHWPRNMIIIIHFLISRCPYRFSGNNRRFNNFNQRDNYQRDFRGGSDNQPNYNNNRYQNGDSERGGNWNNRGGSRTFSRSSGADSRFGQQPPPPAEPENGGDETQPPREPVNTRWQEPPQQEFNNRGGYGGKWNQHGSNAPVDYTVPLARDERIELELFGKLFE